jgi:hypothetical protein
MFFVINPDKGDFLGIVMSAGYSSLVCAATACVDVVIDHEQRRMVRMFPQIMQTDIALADAGDVMASDISNLFDCIGVRILVRERGNSAQRNH